MARYRAKDTLWLDGKRIRPNEEFVSDAKPGKKWELLEASAPPPVAPDAPTETTEDKAPRKRAAKGAE